MKYPNADEFVPVYYQYDPNFEDLLFDGTELRNGMTVLTGDSVHRYPISETMSEGELNYALERNQWCVVTHLQDLGTYVAFFATYEDGRKIKRTCPKGWSWVVKRDTIPLTDNDLNMAERASWLNDPSIKDPAFPHDIQAMQPMPQSERTDLGEELDITGVLAEHIEEMTVDLGTDDSDIRD